MKKLEYCFARLLLFSILLSISISLQAGVTGQDKLFSKAHDAYKEGNYSLAEGFYRELLDSGIKSADIYYNLGNCYFRQQKFAEAILNYERALRIRPGDRNARYNLNLANGFIRDEISVVKPLFVTDWWRRFSGLLPSGGWLAVHILFFVLSLFFTARFLIVRTRIGKLRRFRVSLVLFIVSVLFLGLSLQSHYDTRVRKEGVIMTGTAVIRSGPGILSNTLGEYHSGTKVKITKEDAGWHEVETADGHVGWISGEDIEII